MKNLIAQLTKETSTFRAEYMKQYEEYVRAEYISTSEKYGNTCNGLSEKMEEELNLNCSIQNSSEHFRKYQKVENIISAVCHWFDEEIAKEVRKAEKTFDAKIEKLAFRLEKKGFKNTVKVSGMYTDGDLSCTITDGEQTAHAYTIIASGPVQRPHYRYLVK